VRDPKQVQIHKGGCMCGTVRIKAVGEPLWAATCHCKDCRLATGADRSAYVGFASDKASASGDSFAEYESSPGIFRGFCSKCGTRLTYRGEAWAEELHIHTGVMEEANAFAPMRNVFVKEKLSWVELETGLPARQTTQRAER